MSLSHKIRSFWAIRHFYAAIGAIGVLMIIAAGPVSQLYYPTSEQLNQAFENDLNGIDDGTDFLTVRYTWVDVLLIMLYTGCVLIAAGVVLFTAVQVRAYVKR